MRFAALTVLSFALAVLSLEITVPNAVQFWTNEGQQNLTWSHNANDPSNFTVVLTNPDTSVFTGGDSQVLSALVDSSLSYLAVNPPSAGWPVGRGFIINLVPSPDNLTTIYAKSQKFDIRVPNTTSTTATKPPTYGTPTSFSFSLGPTPTDGNTGFPHNGASSVHAQYLLPAIAFAILSVVRM